MPEIDNPSPLNDSHKAFARDLVALCRKHGVNHIHVAQARPGDFGSPSFSMNWTAGRHGSDSNICIRAEASVSIGEQESGQ